jgi:hypothetical protein
MQPCTTATLRRRQKQLDNDHELLILRLTMDPRKGKGNEDVGAMRRDLPRRLRRMLAALGAELDVDYRSVTYGRRTMLGVAARLGSLGCAKELLSQPWVRLQPFYSRYFAVSKHGSGQPV